MSTVSGGVVNTVLIDTVSNACERTVVRFVQRTLQASQLEEVPTYRSHIVLDAIMA